MDVCFGLPTSEGRVCENRFFFSVKKKKKSQMISGSLTAL